MNVYSRGARTDADSLWPQNSVSGYSRYFNHLSSWLRLPGTSFLQPSTHKRKHNLLLLSQRTDRHFTMSTTLSRRYCMNEQYMFLLKLLHHNRKCSQWNLGLQIPRSCISMPTPALLHNIINLILSAVCRSQHSMLKRNKIPHLYQPLLVKFIEHNQNYYLKTWRFDFYQGLHQKKLVLSSSGSWHNGKTPCQESDRMRGSVGSCPHHSLWPVLPFRCVWPLWSIW